MDGTDEARLTAAVVGSALWAGIRSWTARRVERRVAARLPTGENGVVLGAEPIRLPGGSRGSVLLLHGFGDTPQSMAGLAAALHVEGWSVAAPLLGGHGRLLPAFARSGASAWLADAGAALRDLRATGAPVSIVGQSMGGALAVLLAAGDARTPAVVLLAPYLVMPPRVAWLARWHALATLLTRYVPSRTDGSIRDPAARAAALGIGVTTPRLLHELRGLAQSARDALARVSAATLVIQSRDDNRISPADAMESFERLRSGAREFRWTSGSGHVITADRGREQVFAWVVEWLDRHGDAPGRPTGAT